MAVLESGSMRANVADTALRAHSEPPYVETAIDTEVPGKWHPATTLAFLVVSCVLLWAGIFAGLALLF